MHEDDHDPDAHVWVVLCDGKVREIHPTEDDAAEARADYLCENTGQVWEVMCMWADNAKEALRTGRRVR